MSQNLNEDWSLIEKFGRGDATAFQEIFSKHKSRVVNLSYRFVHSQEAAEDIAQDVFIKIYEKRLRVDSNVKFTTWLYRVTTNASLDFIRKNKFVVRSVDAEITDPSGKKTDFLERVGDPNAPSPSDTAQLKELQALLRTEINGLPEELRAPLLLYQFENLPYEEIARVLKITTKAVERRLYHAKQRLRDKLSKYL
jgi:RNA polymerase sigma-70 factor (ECF subfamily)